VLVGRQREGVGGKLKLLSVVEAEEEVGDGAGSVVDDLDGLGVAPAELHDLGLD
jgi:hypothetical protein